MKTSDDGVTISRPAADAKSLIPLSAQEIHLWLADYDEINDERVHHRYRSLLTAAEREREPRFHFARDRRRYLVTRALVRTVLARYEPVSPEDWVFSTNAYGRPEIASVMGWTNLTFNLSHTDSLIVLGITRGRALGVDVENVIDRQLSISIADRYFALSEVIELAREPYNRRQDRFFEYWTFKESYIKARGMGLSIPLDKFSFSYPRERAVELAIDPELADAPKRWQFWQFRQKTKYLVAICAERLDVHSPTIVVRESIPMIGEKMLATSFTRASA